MKFIKTPYLPQNDVTFGIAGIGVEKYINGLKGLNIEVLVADSEPSVPKPVKDHADLSVHYLGDGRALLSKTQKKVKTELENFGCKCRFINKSLGNAYPEDCKLNCVVNSSDLICNYAIVSDTLKELVKDRRIINTRQGYTKCSLCPVTDKAFITDDKSISSALIKAGYDVLDTEKGSVTLKGYSYGFIGGACFKASKNTLAFFGDIKTHKSYSDIKAFCANYGIDLLSLDSGDLCDIGSFIPILEKE